MALLSSDARELRGSPKGTLEGERYAFGVALYQFRPARA